MQSLTIIVPCLNEEGCVVPFYEEVTKTLAQKDVAYRMLFVDDGSQDGTLREIKRLCGHDNRVGYVSFSRNFGKEAAMKAGLERVDTDLAVFMDADLQHPPRLLPRMLEVLHEENVHLVGAQRKGRNDQSKSRQRLSNLYTRLSRRLLHDLDPAGATDYRVMDRLVIQALQRCPEADRYTKGLWMYAGFPTKWIPYENIERKAGTTKWNLSHLFGYALSAHLSTTAFWSCALTGCGLLFALLTVAAILWLVLDFSKTALVLVVLCVLADLQYALMALMAILLCKTNMEVKHRPLYVVQEASSAKNAAFK